MYHCEQVDRLNAAPATVFSIASHNRIILTANSISRSSISSPLAIRNLLIANGKRWMVNGKWDRLSVHHSPFAIYHSPFRLCLGALWVRSPRKLWSSIRLIQSQPKTTVHIYGGFSMKQINVWKTLTIAAIFSLVVAAQPVVTYACGSAGGHGGC